MNVYQRVIPASSTVHFDSFIDYCALVYGCCFAIYRPRRKKGRIKCDVEKRHFNIGEQKVDENAGDVPHFDPEGDKNTLSTPNVTNGLLHTRDPLPHSATIHFLELDAAAAGQLKRRTRCHATSGTISNALYLGATGRYGSRIQRSLTHTQRESSNAKFHCQRHERVVVFCFGVLTCAMFTLLITKPTTHISLGNKTHFIEEFLLFYHPFRFSFSFPAPKQASPTSSRLSRPTIARKLVKDNNCAKGRPNYLGCRRCFKELPAQIAPDQGHIILSARDGKILRWFDPTNDHHFSGEHISISETFPVSLLIDSFYPTFGHEIRDDSHEGGLLFLIF